MVPWHDNNQHANNNNGHAGDNNDSTGWMEPTPRMRATREKVDNAPPTARTTCKRGRTKVGLQAHRFVVVKYLVQHPNSGVRAVLHHPSISKNAEQVFVVTPAKCLDVVVVPVVVRVSTSVMKN